MATHIGDRRYLIWRTTCTGVAARSEAHRKAHRELGDSEVAGRHWIPPECDARGFPPIGRGLVKSAADPPERATADPGTIRGWSCSNGADSWPLSSAGSRRRGREPE